MSLLSDERIFNTILQFPKTRSLVPQKEVQEFARAIEAAVLEELAKQKPAYTFHLDSTGAAYLRGECVSKEGDPLYAAPVVQPGYKLLKDTTHDERSWPEDSSHENGAYFCMCHHCGRQFTGYKRRVTCKVCAAVIAAAEGKSNTELNGGRLADRPSEAV